MEAIGHDATGNFALRGTCPYAACRRSTVFTRVSSQQREVRVVSAKTFVRWIAILQCQGCRKYILAEAEQWHGQSSYVYIEHYPIGSPDDSVANEVPEVIGKAFREALRCRWMDAYQATVLMCRRALQVSCDVEFTQEQQGKEETVAQQAAKQHSRKDLFTLIDELAAKQKITETLRMMAQRIRLLGKKGAHGDYSDIDDTIAAKDADDAITFMRHYLDHVYVLPARLAEPKADEKTK